MDSKAYSIKVPGKWILAGEHSILRGSRAIAIPKQDLFFELCFEPTSSGGISIYPETSRKVIKSLFDSLVRQEKWKPYLEGINGNLKVESTIPLGAGLGSSASLCVALTKWLSSILPIDASEACKFATELENNFHGKSSGIDIAVIYYGEPICVTLKKSNKSDEVVSEIRRISVSSLPHFTFHDTLMRASTRECVQKVEEFGKCNPTLGESLDKKMDHAAGEAEKGIIEYASGDKEAGLKMIGRAMRESQECFSEWGILPQAARDLEKKLKEEGAIASRLTGSGNGGMVVALWPENKKNIKFGMKEGIV